MSETLNRMPDLLPQHVPALRKLTELAERGDLDFIEAGTTYGFHYATFKAMERLGYVTVATKVQSAIHQPFVAYRVAYLTEAGAAAYATHVARESTTT